MKDIKTSEFFDPMKCACGNPECDDEVFLHPRCHPGAGLELRYDKKHKAVQIRCNKCQSFVINIAVASEVMSDDNARMKSALQMLITPIEDEHLHAVSVKDLDNGVVEIASRGLGLTVDEEYED